MFNTVKSTLERALWPSVRPKAMETNPLLLREERPFPTTTSDGEEDTVKCSDSGDEDAAISALSRQTFAASLLVSILLLLIFVKIVAHWCFHCVMKVVR